jgi:hypothetical protein
MVLGTVTILLPSVWLGLGLDSRRDQPTSRRLLESEGTLGME